MIKTYEDNAGKRTKVCFIIKDNSVTSVIVGNQAVMTKQGIQFYVDDYVAEQIHKFNLVMDGFEPKLELKEGEQLFVPKECEAYKKQKEIEELEKKLKELKGDAE